MIENNKPINMKKLVLNLKNCYGIKKFEEELDFSSSKVFTIYASNGAMKTSFAKTFQDLSKGLESKDLIFPERETVRNLKKEAKENGFLIKLNKETLN